MWGCAAVIPGLHHFYLGNTNRGFKYLFTANEAYAGWLLDLFEMHVLIQASVQEHGHTNGLFGQFPHPQKSENFLFSVAKGEENA
jgi:TM2 domain-containing membrane protein YozV